MPAPKHLASALLFAGLLWAVCSHAAAPDPPTFMLKWGSVGAANGQFNQPTAVATDEQGNVYVLDTYNYRVQKFDRLGNFITQWGGYGSANGQLYNPSGIAVDLSGNVFVSDGGNARIQKFTSAGAYISQWGTYGSGAGQFAGMGKPAVDAAGNVYVPDQARVQKFTNAGVFITQWGSLGSGNGQFNGPNAVAVDAAGNVYVVDRLNTRIEKFTSSGTYVTQWSQAGSNMSDVAVDALGDVYVVDDNGHLTRYSSSGTFEIQWGSAGTGDGQFNAPKAVEVDAEGNLYVADSYNNRMQKFSGWGGTVVNSPHAYLMQFGASGNGNGQFLGIVSVAVDAAGNIYALDQSRVQKFGPSGNYITQWGSAGSGDGQFSTPLAIACDGASYVYVADANNHRVQKFTTSGAFVTKWGVNGGGAGQFHQTQGIAVDASGNVYVTDIVDNRVQKFTGAGTFVTQWGMPGAGAGQFNQPYGVACDVAGNVYIVDSNNDRVQEFTSTGAYITSWGTPGMGDGQFDTAAYIALDANGDVYVTDIARRNVQHFTNGGAFVGRWGSLGSGDGQFNTPNGVATDATGNVLVADYGNNRIEKFATAPALAFVSDVRNDQGRAARLRILRTSGDAATSGGTITGYAVYRRQDPPPASYVAGGNGVAREVARLASPNGVALAGWDYVTTVPARGDAEYGVVVPTFADANAAARNYSAFFVSALTASPYQYFDSQEESGYSIDNLSPGAPTPFFASYVAGATNLHWGTSTAADFATFRLYRGASADFTPGAGNLVATPLDTTYADAGAAGRYYKLSAVDVNGNESPFAIVTPSQTLGVDKPAAARAFALQPVRPNPAPARSLKLHISLPDAAPAELSLIDIAGRTVAARLVSGAGEHVVPLGHDVALAPGIYLVRLAQASTVRTTRVAIVE